MSLRLRLLLSFMSIILLVSIVGTTIILTLQDINTTVEETNERLVPNTIVILDDRGDLLAVLAAAIYTIQSGNPVFWQTSNNTLASLRKPLEEKFVDLDAFNDEELQTLQIFYRELDELLILIEEAVQARLDGKSAAEINGMLNRTLLKLTPLIPRFDDFVSTNRTQLNDNTTLTTTKTQQGTSTIAIGTALTIALTVVIAFLAIRSTFPAIQRIQEGTLRFGEGDLHHRIPLESNTELGRLAQTFNEMAASLQKREAEIVEQREIAEKANHIKSAFLASMSHELRTPLNAMINFTMFVAEGMMGPVNDRQKENLIEAIDSANQLLTLINDVLDISKIESGSLSLFVEDQLDLKPIANQVMSTGKGLLGTKPVTLIADIPPTLPTIRGDRQRILQILLNIMSNACKFTDTGEIKFSVVVKGDRVQFAIQDSGSGIATEEYALIFESFQQASAGIRRGSGTGLGMSISQRLAEAHGGKVWFESEVGKGSTFYLDIPIRTDKLTPNVFISPKGVGSAVQLEAAN